MLLESFATAQVMPDTKHRSVVTLSLASRTMALMSSSRGTVLFGAAGQPFCTNDGDGVGVGVGVGVRVGVGVGVGV